MIWKIGGIVLLCIGGAIIVVLLMYGGPVFPHIFGPGALAVVGAVLLAVRKKGKVK